MALLKDHLSLAEVAAIVGVHERTIVRWIDTGKVNVKKKKDRKGHYRFTKQDLAKLTDFANLVEEVDS